jgi:hypothetical protein
MRGYIFDEIRKLVPMANVLEDSEESRQVYRSDQWPPELVQRVFNVYARAIGDAREDNRLAKFGDMIVYYPYSKLRQIISRDESGAAIAPVERFADAIRNKVFIPIGEIRQFEIDARNETQPDRLNAELKALYDHNATVELAALKRTKFQGGTGQLNELGPLYAKMRQLFTSNGELTQLGQEVLEKLSPG